MIDLSKLAEPGSIEETLLDKIDLTRLPRHIAVIMDGNGRWAKSRNLPRVEGHRAGIASVREIVETAARLELRVVTLYAFSVENWKRPRYEVATLMMLLKEYLRKELQTLMENNIRFTPIGRIDGLDPSVQRELRYAEEKTAANSGLLFQIALNYGGRAEIVDTVPASIAEPVRMHIREMAKRLATKQALMDLSESALELLVRRVFAKYLGIDTSTNSILDRIYGVQATPWCQTTEHRQRAIELIGVSGRGLAGLLPREERHLFEAIIDFQSRERRYGAVEPADAQMFIEADGKSGE